MMANKIHTYIHTYKHTYIRLSFVSIKLNENVFGSKQFKNYRELSNTIIDRSNIYDSFKKRLDKLKDSIFNFNIICYF